MAGSESTAIVDMLRLMGNKPLAGDSADDLFAPPPALREPRQAWQAPRARPRAITPPGQRVPLPGVHGGTLAAVPIRRRPRATQAASTLSKAASDRRLWVALGAAMIGSAAVIYAATRSHATPPVEVAAVAPSTLAVSPPVITTPASVPPAPTAPAAIAPVTAARSAPVLVDIRLDSQPSGAAVTLLDGQKSSPLGETPLAASLDRSRAYDVLLAFPGHGPKLVHVDPRATTAVVVTFDAPAALAPARATAVAKAAPARHPHHAQARVASARRDDDRTGVLMISTKPPCQIAIDGTPTGLTTPQTSIDLTAGTHRVTLTNSALHVTRTVSVRITPSGSTKLVRDFMK